MPGKHDHVGLPRRVTAYYLMFGLGAIVWLTIGIVVMMRALSTSQADTTFLTRLARAAAEAEAEYARHESENLQALVERIRSDGALAYCAIASDDGRYLAHSRREQIGQSAQDPTGATERWGNIQRIRFI